MRVLLPALAVLVGLSGCLPGVEEVAPPEPTPALPEPGLQLEDGEQVGWIDFGAVIWDQPQERTVRLKATGDGSIGFSLTVSGDGFELVGPTSFTLQSGDVVDVSVRLAPAFDGPATGRLTVTPDELGILVHLDGEGLAPTPLFEPDLDLPDVSLGCEGDHEFAIANGGRRPLELGAAVLETTVGGLLELSGGEAAVLQPGEQASLILCYVPRGVGDTVASVVLPAALPLGDELRVDVRGHAEHERWVVDTFVQGPSPAVDLLLIVDNSGSALDSEQPFLDFVTGLIPLLVAAGVDYHIAVVTTDRGDGGMFVNAGGARSSPHCWPTPSASCRRTPT